MQKKKYNFIHSTYRYVLPVEFKQSTVKRQIYSHNLDYLTTASKKEVSLEEVSQLVKCTRKNPNNI